MLSSVKCFVCGDFAGFLVLLCYNYGGLVARERINSNIQGPLDRISDEWGLKVAKVEIKLIDPPVDIKAAMHKQKTAEQERRAMKLLSTGRFEAAEQDKLASIQIAEGKAKAIELVNDAA